MPHSDLKFPFPETAFNPFCDRLSRDIRNSLSTAFIRALASGDPALFRTAISRWLSTQPPPACVAYLRQRQRRYDDVFEQIQENGITHPLYQAIIIWNAALFFEVHERLEASWRTSTGDQRQALRGWILAAGAYVHLENGRHRTARRLAAKAANLLCTHRYRLSFIANLQALLDSLRAKDPVAPRLDLAH